jgi:hypothetical protein
MLFRALYAPDLYAYLKSFFFIAGITFFYIKSYMFVKI